MTEEELLAAWRAEIAAGIRAKQLARVDKKVTLWSQEPLQSEAAFTARREPSRRSAPVKPARTG